MNDCKCWLMRSGSSPLSEGYRSATAKKQSHYMDLLNADIDEDKAPCYVLCGLSYMGRPMDPESAYLDLAIIGDKQVATCPYCIDIRATLENRSIPIREVLY